jgi:hypothetical protein
MSPQAVDFPWRRRLEGTKTSVADTIFQCLSKCLLMCFVSSFTDSHPKGGPKNNTQPTVIFLHPTTTESKTEMKIVPPAATHAIGGRVRGCDKVPMQRRTGLPIARRTVWQHLPPFGPWGPPRTKAGLWWYRTQSSTKPSINISSH